MNTSPNFRYYAAALLLLLLTLVVRVQAATPAARLAQPLATATLAGPLGPASSGLH